MKSEISVTALANDQNLQFKMIADAYATKDEAKIDTALIRVSSARRMKSNGTLDMIADCHEGE